MVVAAFASFVGGGGGGSSLASFRGGVGLTVFPVGGGCRCPFWLWWWLSWPPLVVEVVILRSKNSNTTCFDKMKVTQVDKGKMKRKRTNRKHQRKGKI